MKSILFIMLSTFCIACVSHLATKSSKSSPGLYGKWQLSSDNCLIAKEGTKMMVIKGETFQQYSKDGTYIHGAGYNIKWDTVINSKVIKYPLGDLMQAYAIEIDEDTLSLRNYRPMYFGDTTRFFQQEQTVFIRIE